MAGLLLPDGPPDWMTYGNVASIADGYVAREFEVVDLAREVLRAWDLLETQVNQLYKLRENAQ